MPWLYPTQYIDWWNLYWPQRSWPAQYWAWLYWPVSPMLNAFCKPISALRRTHRAGRVG